MAFQASRSFGPGPSFPTSDEGFTLPACATLSPEIRARGPGSCGRRASRGALAGSAGCRGHRGDVTAGSCPGRTNTISVLSPAGSLQAGVVAEVRGPGWAGQEIWLPLLSLPRRHRGRWEANLAEEGSGEHDNNHLQAGGE